MTIRLVTISRRSTLDTRHSVAVDENPDHSPAKSPKTLRSQFGQNYDDNSARNSHAAVGFGSRSAARIGRIHKLT